MMTTTDDHDDEHADDDHDHDHADDDDHDRRPR